MVLPSSRTLTVSVKGSQRPLVSSIDAPTGGRVEGKVADVIGQQEGVEVQWDPVLDQAGGVRYCEILQGIL